MRKREIIIIAAIAAVALLLLTLSAFDVRLRVVSYGISDDRIKTPVRIVFLTDLHSCRYGKEQGELLDVIDAQKPDIILLGGDIFDDDLPNENTIMVLTHLANLYPCFYVSGNHEYWNANTEELFDTVRALNISILHGICETVSFGQTRLNICGIADPDGETHEPITASMEDQLRKARDAEEKDCFTILLAHRPERIESYAKYGFDLVLSGHAHGGQIRIPGIINGFFSPGEGWFPKYTGGEYEIGDTRMIVSRGLSRESTRVPRIWNRPELVVIDLAGTN